MIRLKWIQIDGKMWNRMVITAVHILQCERGCFVAAVAARGMVVVVHRVCRCCS